MSSTLAGVTSRHATAGGVNLFFVEAGPKGAPTVVLLHGYPSSSRMYAPLIPMLADRCRLIAPDYPGFGQSEAPPPSRYRYTFDHLAETTGALAYARDVPDAEIHILDAGHFALDEQADQVAQLTRNFLVRHIRLPGGGRAPIGPAT
jgi:pimeloyl-ACP methyl ester carboxylesterase